MECFVNIELQHLLCFKVKVIHFMVQCQNLHVGEFNNTLLGATSNMHGCNYDNIIQNPILLQRLLMRPSCPRGVVLRPQFIMISKTNNNIHAILSTMIIEAHILI